LGGGGRSKEKKGKNTTPTRKTKKGKNVTPQSERRKTRNLDNGEKENGAPTRGSMKRKATERKEGTLR